MTTSTLGTRSGRPTTELAAELLFVATATGGHARLGGVRSAMALAAQRLQLAPSTPDADVVTVSTGSARTAASHAGGAPRPMRRRSHRYAMRRQLIDTR
jgi:hypothetical protein